MGTKFEKLTIDFFRNDSMYKNRFEKVWRYADWAREYDRNKNDLGIDLVAREKKEGKEEFCAIQCKFFRDSTAISKPDIDSFFAEVGKHNLIKNNIKNTILVFTGEELGKNVESVLKDSQTGLISSETFRSSSIDWSLYPKVIAKNPKKLRDYQQNAFKDVIEGFETGNRGKMIMACGTGKTLVSLHIAEKLAGKGKMILYLVPSISLILQSMREWSDNANIPHYYMSVCSDSSVRNLEDGSLIELESPASTDIDQLKDRLDGIRKNAMNVIFSTYHSIDVVSQAMGGKKFDMVFCDEAHRTAVINAKDESFYTKVHSDKNIAAAKRLYLTATPRVYSDIVKTKATEKERVPISMDDESIYGPEFHHLNFHDAVYKYDALCDFQIHVTVMDGDMMDSIIQKANAGDDNMIPLNEKTLLASVWHAIQYPDLDKNPRLLQRVIMFCDVINSSKLLAGDQIAYKSDFREKPQEEQAILIEQYDE